MIYFCGNKLVRQSKKQLSHTIFLFDLKECTIAEIYSDGSFNILAHKTSQVSNKHRQGGQSSQRFERGRMNLILNWFKKLDSIVTNINGPIKVGSHEFYQKQFINSLTPGNRLKCVEYFNSEYCDESGVWQYINHGPGRI